MRNRVWIFKKITLEIKVFLAQLNPTKRITFKEILS